VKSPPFAYVAPETLDEVVHHLVDAGDDAKLIAGGQSLLPVLALRLGRPSVLVDVGRVPDLDTIEVTDTGVVLGARVTHAELERHRTLAAHAPLLAEVAPFIGHAAIRTRGTLGGSLAHADPAAELPAAVVLCGASITARGPGGTRSIAAVDFFDGYLTTVLADDEVLESVHVPRRPRSTGDAFAEVSRRHGDFALVGAGARVRLDDDGRVAEVRLVFLGAGSTPVLDGEAGAAAVGRPPDAVVFGEVGRAAAARLEPHDDLHASASYRRRVAGALAARVLATATRRAGSPS
jgi:aerobic carbon-monoxide dehydrogenase medium subunit